MPQANAQDDIGLVTGLYTAPPFSWVGVEGRLDLPAGLHTRLQIGFNGSSAFDMLTATNVVGIEDDSEWVWQSSFDTALTLGLLFGAQPIDSLGLYASIGGHFRVPLGSTRVSDADITNNIWGGIVDESTIGTIADNSGDHDLSVTMFVFELEAGWVFEDVIESFPFFVGLGYGQAVWANVSTDTVTTTGIEYEIDNVFASYSEDVYEYEYRSLYLTAGFGYRIF